MIPVVLLKHVLHANDWKADNAGDTEHVVAVKPVTRCLNSPNLLSSTLELAYDPSFGDEDAIVPLTDDAFAVYRS
jgi:hypothetical protein